MQYYLNVQNSSSEPSGAVVVELKDGVLLRVGEVDATVDAVQCQLLRRQQIMTTMYKVML